MLVSAFSLGGVAHAQQAVVVQQPTRQELSAKRDELIKQLIALILETIKQLQIELAAAQAREAQSVSPNTPTTIPSVTQNEQATSTSVQNPPVVDTPRNRQITVTAPDSVTAGDEVTVSWLISGESSNCTVTLPSGVETAHEEQTKKFVLSSDFNLSFECVGKASGIGFSKSVLIRVK